MTTWTCHICGEERPDDRIDVYSTDLSIENQMPPGTMKQNVRHCNDRPGCIAGARTKRLFGSVGKVEPVTPYDQPGSTPGAAVSDLPPVLDSSNQCLVMPKGPLVIVYGLGFSLAKAKALNLAAWIVALVDPDEAEFRKVINAIKRS